MSSKQEQGTTANSKRHTTTGTELEEGKLPLRRDERFSVLLSEDVQRSCKASGRKIPYYIFLGSLLVSDQGSPQFRRGVPKPMVGEIAMHSKAGLNKLLVIRLEKDLLDIHVSCCKGSFSEG
ncbi:uncharacterized protein LOC130749675 [Lotus japonicus]|uniref:uncharacterized protein LOC130710192 n=1 Tax=Lotus japonicus TaxID=34305 RepID=UPI00258D0803|nr:uncharacterized protein LOC130710192 [Lotus japonicus]XP_057459030.1 uncharacterized protein LOC130749675 [Lotus japonicus]